MAAPIRPTSASARRSRRPRPLGAERTFLTHLTHETGHAELARQLPAGHRPGLRRTHGGGRAHEVRTTDACLQDRLDGEHGLPARSAGRAAAPLRRGAGGGSRAGGSRASTASTGWASRTQTVQQIKPLRRAAWGRPSTTCWCSASAARRSGRGRCSPRSGARAGTSWTTRGGNSSRASPCSTTSTRPVVAEALRRIDPRRVLVNVISKSGGTAETMAQYLVVRHVARTGARGRRRRGTSSSPPIRPRARCGRSPRARGSPRSRCRRTSAGGSACSRRWACFRRRWSASTSKDCWPAQREAVARAESDDLLAEPGRALRRAPLGGRYRRSAPGSTC